MSYQTPVAYAPVAYPTMDPKLELAIPSALESDPGYHFRGARSTIKYIPASTGSSIGPSASTMFMIPQTAYGFIKPSSMYLRCKVVVSIAGNADSAWAFAPCNKALPTSVAGFVGFGQPASVAAAQSSPTGFGGASAVIQRLTVTFPGGVQCSYPQYNTWRGAILPHVLSREFFMQDLRELEHAAAARVATDGAAVSRTAWVCIPLDLPCFNAAQAFPLCLLSGGIQIELQTDTVVRSFITPLFNPAGTQATDFAVSDLALIYDELIVSPEFKAAVVDKAKLSPFSLALNDRLYMGAISGGASSRTNFGVGLSSLKSVVGTIIRDQDQTRTDTTKAATSNSLNYWNLYLNGQQMTPSNLDNDAMVFAELQRSLQMLNDSNVVSALEGVSGTVGNSDRNNYCGGQFAFGASVAAYDDRTFALRGVAADQVQVELVFGGSTLDKWQRNANTDLNTVNPAQVYLWALHDTILTVNPDGTIAIRK